MLATPPSPMQTPRPRIRARAFPENPPVLRRHSPQDRHRKRELRPICQVTPPARSPDTPPQLSPFICGAPPLNYISHTTYMPPGHSGICSFSINCAKTDFLTRVPSPYSWQVLCLNIRGQITTTMDVLSIKLISRNLLLSKYKCFLCSLLY